MDSRKKHYLKNMIGLLLIFSMFILAQWFIDNEKYIMAGGARRDLERVSFEITGFGKGFDWIQKGLLLGPFYSDGELTELSEDGLPMQLSVVRAAGDKIGMQITLKKITDELYVREEYILSQGTFYWLCITAVVLFFLHFAIVKEGRKKYPDSQNDKNEFSK